MVTEINIRYVPKIFDFFEANPNAQIYIIAGGRGKGATWGIGNQLICEAMEAEHFILCTREIKDSIDHSSRRTIERLITKAKLQDQFIFHRTETICKVTGSRFIYTGLSKITEDNVQGMEGITRAWLGEAHTMEQSTWQKFEPTVRDNSSVIYIDYNVHYSNTPIHALFTENPLQYPFEGKRSIPELAYLFMSYEDNIFLPERLKTTIERNKLQYSTADFDWIWRGFIKDASERYTCNELDVRAAMERKVPFDASAVKVCGCDIAHMGGDEIVFYQRRGFTPLDNGYITSMKRTTEVADELEAYIEFDKNTILVIDNGHVGAALADMMELRGYYVERINFGGVKEMHFDAEHCKDCATDMAFNFTKLLPQMQLPKDELLCNQVSQRRWDFVNNKGIRKIESKDDFKKHATHLEGHTSPDRGDAIWLCYYNRAKVRNPLGLGSMIKVWN